MRNPRDTGRAWALLLTLSLATVASAATWNVNVQNFSFVPANITVAPGDTINWIWVNGIHTVTSGTGCTHNTPYFNAPIDSGHPLFSYVVPTGVPSIPYYCQPHCATMQMTGTITVQSNEIQNFVITIDGYQEVPPVTTTAVGSGTATLDLQTNLFSWNISYSGVTATASHFHGPALACANAGIVINVGTANPTVGSAALTAGQAADLLAGKWYYNVHSAAFPAGEIRGQVMPAALADPLPDPIAAGTYARLVPVASGLTAPNWGVSAPGNASELFVTDQNGILWAINKSTGAKRVFLDVTTQLVALGIFGPDSFDERGLLGVAFHPNYQSNGLLYTFQSEPYDPNYTADFSTLPMTATPNCFSVIAEWEVSNPADPNAVVSPASKRVLMRVAKPQFNHNGGALEFGPDGYLYVSFGDGGAGDDRDGPSGFFGLILGHGCDGNGQNINAILGKLIRIDPLGNNSANGQYGIPPTNPFVGVAGLDEIWSLGWRNPWRFSFDTGTGTLWCPDVGQNDVEEINTVVSGGNYGWRAKEGSFYFVFNGDQPGYVTDVPLTVPLGLIDPIAEYGHNNGLAVVGGFVYRGTKWAGLLGKFVFGDFAQSFSNDGRLFYLDSGDEIKEFQLIPSGPFARSLLGFGQDSTGEIYVMANTTGTPFGTTGVVLRLAPPYGDMNCDGVVNFGDINPFVKYVTDCAGWQAQYVGCPPTNGDIDQDGQHACNGFLFDDINAFVSMISSGSN